MERYKMFAMLMTSLGLMFLVVGVSYSFFNYTRTGDENNVRTGRIFFNTTEGDALNLTNMFPMTSSEAASANLDSLTIGIVGDTNYPDGEEFRISIVDVNNTVSNKEVPLNFTATYTAASGGTIGTSNDNYMTARNSKDATIYKLTTSGAIEEDKEVLVGYIDNGVTGISGTLTIKAYIDADRIAITDTYNGPQSTPNDQNGTTSEWVRGREVFTTTEWNGISSNPISFKIKAESNEGIWVGINNPSPSPTPTNLGTIDSCPGCKFIYTENRYSYGTNGSSLSEITANNDVLVDDYRTLNKDYFLGFKMENNIIAEAYVCEVKPDSPNQGTPFCLRGLYYEDVEVADNILASAGQMLLTLWGESDFSSGNCTEDGVGYTCQGTYEVSYAQSLVYIYSASNFNTCAVNQEVWCGEPG